tara:strand:+ start:1010 stop:1270 length:261 start_codon:yes stop_codon:yes gene_type:complete
MAKKYPPYFYENRPDWVEILDAIKISTKPNQSTRKPKYCGNCRYIKNIRTEVEPYCGKHDVAIRGHWYCKSWKRGDADDAKTKSLN